VTYTHKFTLTDEKIAPRYRSERKRFSRHCESHIVCDSSVFKATININLLESIQMSNVSRIISLMLTREEVKCDVRHKILSRIPVALKIVLYSAK